MMRQVKTWHEASQVGAKENSFSLREKSTTLTINPIVKQARPVGLLYVPRRGKADEYAVVHPGGDVAGEGFFSDNFH